jgi:predicted MFS family arabinose efflux permease
MSLWSGACLTFALLLEGGTWPVALAFLAVAGCAAGLFISPNNSIVMSLAPPGKEGAASEVSKTFTTLAMTVGVCLMETIFSSFLPAGATEASIHGVHSGVVLVGFRYAYLAVCAVAVAGALFSLARGPKGVPVRDGGPKDAGDLGGLWSRSRFRQGTFRQEIFR